MKGTMRIVYNKSILYIYTQHTKQKGRERETTATFLTQTNKNLTIAQYWMYL